MQVEVLSACFTDHHNGAHTTSPSAVVYSFSTQSTELATLRSGLVHIERNMLVSHYLAGSLGGDAAMKTALIIIGRPCWLVRLRPIPGGTRVVRALGE